MKKNILFIFLIIILVIFCFIILTSKDKNQKEQNNTSETEEANNSQSNENNDNSKIEENINIENEEENKNIEITNNEDEINNSLTKTTSKGFTINNDDGVYTIDDILIVNKTYSLPKNYGNGLTSELTDAFNNMKDDALKDGITLKIISGFRSYDTQVSTYNYWVSKYGKTEADTISARPGHSEHQTGLAIDINSLEKAFKNTEEGKWLNDNAYKYGFILRYPEGTDGITGYSFEPWHYRYVETELSYKLYNDGNWITMEEYFGITSKYQ